jgi:hypothetical protein
MAINERDRDDISFEITEHLGVISQYPTGWTKQANMVAWNGGTPKVDVRDWDPDMEHMSRGITLHKDEAIKLRDILQSMDLDKGEKKQEQRDNSYRQAINRNAR